MAKQNRELKEPWTRIDDDLVQRVDAISIELMSAGGAPCLKPGRDGESCVARERKTTNRDGLRRSWAQFRVDDFCACCAAYWHVTTARDRLLVAKRRGNVHGN